MTTRRSARKAFAFAGIALLCALTLAGVFMLVSAGSGPADAQSFHVPPPPDVAARQADRFGVPQNAAPGRLARADFWRMIRRGVIGHVAIGGPQAGVLVQANGENFRLIQNVFLPAWGGWLILAVVIVLAVFFAVRGRIRIEEGLSGRKVDRFSLFERFTHWLTAISFVLLALTGLNILYGRYVLKPIMGAYPFAIMTAWGKYIHDYVAFAFMLGLAMMFLAWVRNNLPTLVDLKWLVKGGGMFVKGSHPPAYKFNAGQKILFWIIVLAGFSVSLSGLCLLMPLTLQPFAPTFSALNVLGLHLPTTLTPLEETQLALVWHAIVALALIGLIIAHIYIGTLGMEGAFGAMVDGKVDENWAREHHALWLEQVKTEADETSAQQPAE